MKIQLGGGGGGERGFGAGGLKAGDGGESFYGALGHVSQEICLIYFCLKLGGYSPQPHPSPPPPALPSLNLEVICWPTVD